MTIDDLIERLTARITAAGSAVNWAREVNLSPSYVSDVLNRVRAPGPSMLKALGLVEVTTYREA